MTAQRLLNDAKQFIICVQIFSEKLVEKGVHHQVRVIVLVSLENSRENQQHGVNDLIIQITLIKQSPEALPKL